MGVGQDVLVRLLLSERAMLLGYIGSLVRDSHLAEDIFQDVALIVLRKRDELSDSSGFPVWARKIARLESMNVLRRETKLPRPLDQSVLDVLDRHWTQSDEGPAPAALRACVTRLTERSRKLVELRYRDGLSGKRLAERLAQPLNTVYVTLARIHRALSECVRGRLGAGKASHA
jgi:RNA polymerase sigma-70 factor (ECF subfamily)